MEDEIKRIKKMLAKEDPRTPNYKTLLDNLAHALMVVDLESDAPSEFEKGILKEFPTPNLVDDPQEERTEPIVEEPEMLEEPPGFDTPAIQYTLEEVRAEVKAAQEKGLDVRPFIAAYGVKNLSSVPKESFGDLIQRVKEALNE